LETALEGFVCNSF